MAVSDSQIGRNLARMRGDMSQKELAEEMKKRGWRWSQATVWSIEKGERPLRLAEAEDLKSVLGTMWSLTLRDADGELVAWLQTMTEAYQALESATARFLEVQEQLWGAANANDVSPRIKEAAEDWLRMKPEDVAREKRLRVERVDAAEGQYDDPEA